jgi:outer membrane murein-binding lipoprotein Lpp
MKTKLFLTAVTALLLLTGCTQETQNKLGRAIQNWTGTDGVLEIYSGGKLVRKFIKIDKVSTAVSTDGDTDRPYRYGYGIFDANFNGVADKGEKRVYFEFSDYSTQYVFFENPEH